jgi:PKD domain
MKNALLLFLTLLPIALLGQTIPDKTVQVQARAQDAPPAIILRWAPNAGATGYTVYRKAASATAWGASVASLPATDSTWTDTAIQPGEAWEYRVLRAGTTANGYAFGGLRSPKVEQQGKLILVVDSTWIDSIAPQLARLQEDLVAEGWLVIRHDVAPTDPVTAVRALIQADYTADPAQVKAVFLLGHVPVPYSGNIYPDGHTDHQGAWPCDGYYGELNGNWTDASVNVTAATRPENDNIPGDGKFDQSTIPTDVELMVGRVDFYNMPVFSQPEYQLLRRYLDKDHAWRSGQVQVQPLGVVDDNFGVFPSEAFATNGWRNFAPLVGLGQSVNGDFRGSLTGGNSRLWAYGCGGGSYTSASGVATSSQFAGDSLAGVFTMIFGSYHGDWDSPNNLLRAVIASKGNVLTTAWAGRPDWHFFHMGQGYPIGYGTRLSMNNSFLYTAGGFGARQVHMALMGDPTLRMTVVPPVSQVSATPSGRDVLVAWTASPDSLVVGYHIYRADNPAGPFVRVTADSLLTTSWTDPCLPTGTYTYLVRALKLEDGFSGSYWNLSPGRSATASVDATVTIDTPTLQDSVICVADPLLVDFTGAGAWCNGNTFYIELSDVAGSFVQADTIGSLAGATPAQVACTLPVGLTLGGAYRVRVRSNEGDTLSLGSAAFSLLDVPTAGFNHVTSGTSVAFTSTATLVGSVSWDFGDGDSASTLQPSHTYAAAGTYTVTLTVTNACGTASSNDTVVIQPQVGLPDPLVQGWTLHPNPAQNYLVCEGPGIGRAELVDMGGRVLRAWQVEGGHARLDLRGLAEGVYLLRLTGEARVECLRVVKLGGE